MRNKWRARKRTAGDLLAHLCELRGLDPESLALDYQRGLHDPQRLPNMAAARDLIVQAKKHDWPVTIFGDYDADGTPAAALLSTVLERLGIKHDVIIPTRAQGYGLKSDDVATIAQRSKLLILVDTGVTAVEEIALAKEKGLSVIVLDHHLPKDELPATPALVDPFIPGSEYPFNHLCATALAYKFAEALAVDFPAELTEGFRKWLLDLVAIATVSDMMEMRDENRVLVHYGLQVLRKTRRPGLQALLRSAGLEPTKLTPGNLGFALGPRLNATGRLGDNRPAFDLLVEKDLVKAAELATIIERSNRERQSLVEKVLSEAKEKALLQNSLEDRCFVVVGDNWPTGVLGLVAGKLSSEYYRPTIVLSEHDGVLTGSARSIGDYSIIDGLTSQQQQLTRFGGHRQAAGLAVNKDQFSKFVDGLKAHAESHISAESLQPVYTADAILGENELSTTTAELCENLQPFGFSNQQPLFIIEHANLGRPKFIGQSGDHVKWQARKDNAMFDVIGFGLAKRVTADQLADAHLLGYLEKNEWNNQTRLQLRVIDYQPTDHPIEVI